MSSLLLPRKLQGSTPARKMGEIMSKETQVVVGVDGAEAFAEFQRITQAALRAGDSIEDAFRKGATALDKFDTTTERSSKRQEREARNLVNRIKRQVAAIQAGGRDTADYYEAMARASGTYTKAVEAEVASLRKLEAQQRKTSSGISARQHAAAMRMLPAQMTDITVGLATGQSPFMVMMQQGGQLKDMFGGLVPAAKAVGGAFLGYLTNPALLATVAVAGLAYKMYEGAEEAREFQRAVELAGGRAGITADAMLTMANRIGDSTGEYTLAKEALIELAKSGAVAAGDYEQLGNTIVQMSQASGQSVSDLVAEFVKIKEDPLKAVVELSGKYRTLTGDVYAQVKALQDQGREMEAVRLVQQKYAEESDAMSKRVTENLGYIETAWRGIKGVASDALAEIESWGREDTLAEKIADLRKKIAEQEKAAKELGWSDARLRENGAYNKRKEELAYLTRQLAGQQAQAALEQEAANARERGAKAQAWLSDQAKTAASDAEKHAARLQEIETQRLAALKTATTELAKQAANQNAAKLAAKENADYAERQARATKQSGGAAQQYLAKLEQQRGLPSGLLDAVWHMESRRGKNMGPSSAGALGHFQFMPDTARQYGIRGKEYDFKASADAAARMFADLLKMTGGSVEKALAGYNWGIGNVQKKGMAAMPRETRNYVTTGTRMMRSGTTGQDDIPSGYGNQATAAERYAMQHERTMLGLRTQRMALEQGITDKQQEYLRLLSSDEYQNMSDAERRKAVELAKAADAEREAIKTTGERIEAQKRFAEAVAQSSAAMHELLRVESERYTRELQGMGMGSQWRDRNAAVNQINDRYQAERERYRGELRTGKITQGEFDAWIAEVDAANQKALQMDAQYWHDKLQLQADWRIGAGDALADYAAQVADVASATSQMFTNAFKGMEDAIVNFVKTGKLDFRSLADSIISDMIRIAVQQSITGPLASWMGGLIGGGGASAGPGPFFGNALGGVYNSPGLSAYSGQIVSKPTLFPFAKGIGLMGEAGSEAILPLKRGPGGYLGVRSEGGGGVTVNVINQSGAHVETRERTDESGMPVIDVLLTQLDRKMAAGIRSGNSQSGQAMQSTFGLRRRGQ